jgi:hypothetical protein
MAASPASDGHGIADLTLVSCWYSLKNKFNQDTYGKWMGNFIPNICKFNLVIFTDSSGFDTVSSFINEHNKHLVKVIIREIHELEGYTMKDSWIENHSKNHLLNQRIQWELNMLWSEKIRFVKLAHDLGLITTKWCGWCDIGYFRGRTNDISVEKIKQWPSPEIISSLNPNKIYYGFVGHPNTFGVIKNLCENKTENGLPKTPIPPDQVSVAGGFFITNINMIQWWYDTYYTMLKIYLHNKYLVKDDQMIIINCIVLHLDKFSLVREKNPRVYDEWFVFQRVLCE